MKRIVTIIAVTTALITSCGPKVADVTKLSGNTNLEEVAFVRIVIDDKLDTTVAVSEGKFSVDLPVHLDAVGYIVLNGTNNLVFISDGTPLNLVFKDEQFKIESKYPKVSVTEKYLTYRQKDIEIQQSLGAKYEEISAKEISEEERQDLMEDAYEEVVETYVDYNKAVALKNKDNVIALSALSSVSSLMETDDVLEVLNALSPEMQAHPYAIHLKENLEAIMNTAEGKMYVDFEADHIYALAADGTPLTKKVKFSEYVGQGKYVVVDFWAPWCGPCMAEIPNLVEIYKKHKGPKFDMLSVAVWERQGPQVTLDTIKEKGLSWQHITNTQDIATKVYGIEGIPHIMIVGPDGTIISRNIRGAELAEKVADLLDD